MKKLILLALAVLWLMPAWAQEHRYNIFLYLIR